MRNKRYVGAILNFFVWGLGYLYVGGRRGFGVLLLLGFAFPLLDVFYPAVTLPPLSGVRLVSLASYFIISFAFAYDAYQLEVFRTELVPTGGS